jgi:hypothetical protein
MIPTAAIVAAAALAPRVATPLPHRRVRMLFRAEGSENMIADRAYSIAIEVSRHIVEVYAVLGCTVLPIGS